MAIRVVITGAPASGKTEFVQRLKGLPMFSDFRFFDELARQLLIENPQYRRNWLEFHLEIYRRQVARELSVSGRSFVTDRGTLDAFAFHPEAMPVAGTTTDREYRRYDHVIHLGSAATLGDAFYRNDTIRTESLDQALAIERALASVWNGHAGYCYIPARPNFESKFSDLIDHLEKQTGDRRLDNHASPASVYNSLAQNTSEQEPI